jgi:uncharacterized protein (UPF0248 family)
MTKRRGPGTASDEIEKDFMVPIQHLLNRIRWDKEFGTGSFEIGYLDHVEQRIIRVPSRRIHFEEGNQFSFQLEDEMGEMLSIPFHRIREVYRDGVLIWRRSG